MLETLGIDQLTSQVYKAMLLHQDWGVAQVADHLEVDVERVRDSLDELARKSLLRPSAEHLGQFRAANPSIALSALLSEREALLEAQRAEMARTREAIAQLATEWEATQGLHGYVERLVGVDAVRLRLEELAEKTEFEVLSFMSGGAQSAASLEASRPLDEQHLVRGIRMRSVYLNSVHNDRGTRDYISWMVEGGAEVCTMPSLPIRMIIADRRTAVIPINPEDSKQGCLVLTSQGILIALLALFEAVWAQAEPFGEVKRQSDNDITAQERELLRLLCSGLTDEGVSRQLGVSVRTTRRIVAGLMDRLEARSRFEAGFEAARRGWL